VLSILAKTLETKIGWDSVQYGWITAAFQAAYAVGLLGAGRLIDVLGTRTGFAAAIGLWSVAAMSHAAAASAVAFGAARALLGLGEAANFPACIKTVAEWFPKRERAFATGLFNSGANVGTIFAVLAVPWMAVRFGWQSAFIATGAIGFVWLGFWLAIYRSPEGHPRVSPAEFAYIQSDPPDRTLSVPWARLFPVRETWAFSAAKFLTDPVWWFFLFWLPKYLQETFGLTLSGVMLPTLVVYNASAIGSVGAGWISGGLMKRGWSLNAARKTTMLGCALSVACVMYAPFSKNLWVVVGLVSLAAAAHQGWSANLYTLISDTFPRAAVGSVVGIAGTCGSLGGVLIQVATGYVVQLTHSYVPLFLVCGTAYVSALAILHALSPRLAPAKLEGVPPARP
jgi:ACS family hexuronate transporter-like MFS transporter